MEKDPRKFYENAAERYLQQVGERHVFNKSSGLYESQPNNVTGEGQQHGTRKDDGPPFRVRVLTDRIALVVSIATLALLVATVVYTRRQWLQANRSANASETAAHAAQSAAETAAQTLKEMQTGAGALDTHSIAQTTKDALVDVQRAVMSADDIVMNRQTRDGSVQEFDFVVNWKNSGSTPTLNLKIHTSWMPSPIKLPDSFRFTDKWEQGKPKITEPSFATPQKVIASTAIPVSADIIRHVQNHQIRLYFWGSARYQDVFKDTLPHVSEFCSEITGFRGDPFDMDPSHPVFLIAENCGTYNCHDDECKGK